jgi:hypothetical protein
MRPPNSKNENTENMKTDKQPGPARQPSADTDKPAIRENLHAWRTRGDRGARDRFQTALTGRLVKRFGTRRIGRFADIAAKLSA